MKTTLLLFVLLTFQQPVPDQTLTLNIEGQEVSIKESAARAEYAQLEKAGSVNTPRFVALTIALGTIPGRCTDSQAAAGLCQQPKCITRDQHVAEVNSWWAAPERVYVRCDDPRVKAPKQ